MTLTKALESAFAKHTVAISASLLAVAAVAGWYLGGLGGKKSPTVSGLSKRSWTRRHRVW